MRAIALSLLGLLMTSGPAMAQEASLPTHEDVGLIWTRSPSVRVMTRQYDVATRARGGQRGTVELACTPDVEGRLDCDVTSVSPENWGFDRAALEVMRRTRVAAVDGASPAGRTFGFRLRFGNWGSRALPDSFQPIAYGLRWVERPVMRGWSMRGQSRGDRVSQTYDCSANGNGELACQISGPVSSEAFAEAGLISLNRARVERDDGNSPDGVQFPWTLTVERQSHCNGHRNGNGADAQTQSTIVDNDPSVTTNQASENAIASAEPRCTAAIVQVASN